jgi:hypothetical protein
MSEKTSTRLFLLLAIPPVLIAILVYTMLSVHFGSVVAQQQHSFGTATADLLSDALVQSLVEKDLLSLNVVVTEMANSDSIEFVAVYDDDNTLIAQSGRETDSPSYSKEITFQDSIVGFVRVIITPAQSPGITIPLTLILVACVYAGALWYFANHLLSWTKKTASTTSTPAEIPELEAAGPSQECVLVIRIRPSRHLEAHFEKFFEAAKLYRGIVEQTTTEELVIHFEGQEAMFRAASTGLLIKQMTESINSNIDFGGTLDVIEDDPDKVRKSASYLASIAKGDLIIAGGGSLLGDRAELVAFHHSLVDSKNLNRLSSLVNQETLAEQAQRLSTD